LNSASNQTELKLVESAKSGDRSALERLLVRYQPHIYRFGMKMCGDPEDAKDVLQETMLAVARNVRDFRGGSSMTTWLYSIARSFCIKKRRRSKFAPEHEASLNSVDGQREARAIPDKARGPDEELAGRQIEAALASAIAELAPMYREVLVLRDIEGLTAPEVAEILGVSVEAVKSRLHRARVSVRYHVAPLLGFGEPSPNCPDVLTLLSKHMEGEISADVCAEMERHLVSCPGCRGACDSLKNTLALCRATPEPKVPGPVQESVRKAVERFLSARP
jgi:RNA polymerase sigma-70 factor (ECF subfamily)